MKAAHLAAFFILAALLVLPLSHSSASRRQTGLAATAPCDVRAYVIDRDPAGLNVRSGPGKTFRSVGNLSNQAVEGIGVHITGAAGDWVRIDKALEQGGDQERTLFQGEGWVFAHQLGVEGMAITKGGTNLYQDTNRRSRVVIRVPGGEDKVMIRGCRGQWMYVEYKRKKGWAAPDTLCANSLTTCV